MARTAKLIRAGTLASFPELARTLHLDPARLLRSVGLHKVDLSDEDALIPVTAAIELLERSADAAGIEDFGLRLARMRNLAQIGPVGLLVREEPTVGHVIRAAELYLRRYSEALAFRLDENASASVLRVQYLATTRGRTRQATELLVGTVFRVISALAGNAWSAESVSFSHPAPLLRTLHSSLFKTRILFDNSFNGFILRPSDLKAPIRTADLAMPRYVRHYVAEVFSGPIVDTGVTVRQLIFALLPTAAAPAKRLHVISVSTARRSIAGWPSEARPIRQSSTKRESNSRAVTSGPSTSR